MRASFEIAKSQAKVFEDKSKNLAFWRAGSLVNITSDPVWLGYHRNNRDFPYWQLNKIVTGEAPSGQDGAAFTLICEPPELARRLRAGVASETKAGGCHNGRQTGLLHERRSSNPLESGAPGETRTPDLLVRSQPLYPPELRARACDQNQFTRARRSVGNSVRSDRSANAKPTVFNKSLPFSGQT